MLRKQRLSVVCSLRCLPNTKVDHRLVDAAKRTGSLRLEQFRLYNGLEGPIGAPSDKNTLTGAIYLASDAWKAVAKDNDKHYLNFVSRSRFKQGKSAPLTHLSPRAGHLLRTRHPRREG